MRAFRGGSRAPAMSPAALRIVVRYKYANYWRNLNLPFAASLRARAIGPVTGARLACGRSWAAGDPVVSDLTGGLRGCRLSLPHGTPVGVRAAGRAGVRAR